MTNEEFSNEFDVLANSYSVQLKGREFLNEFDEYEKSVFLSLAEEQLVSAIYSGKSLGGPYEISEEARRQLDNTVVANSASETIRMPNYHAVSNNSYLFQLPKDVLYIVWESVDWGDDAPCGDGSFIPVLPVSHDDYHRIKNNPFRGITDKRVLRLDYAGYGHTEEIQLSDERANPNLLFDMNWYKTSSPTCYMKNQKDNSNCNILNVTGKGAYTDLTTGGGIFNKTILNPNPGGRLRITDGEVNNVKPESFIARVGGQNVFSKATAINWLEAYKKESVHNILNGTVPYFTEGVSEVNKVETIGFVRDEDTSYSKIQFTVSDNVYGNARVRVSTPNTQSSCKYDTEEHGLRSYIPPRAINDDKARGVVISISGGANANDLLLSPGWYTLCYDVILEDINDENDNIGSPELHVYLESNDKQWRKYAGEKVYTLGTRGSWKKRICVPFEIGSRVGGYDGYQDTRYHVTIENVFIEYNIDAEFVFKNFSLVPGKLETPVEWAPSKADLSKVLSYYYNSLQFRLRTVPDDDYTFSAQIYPQNDSFTGKPVYLFFSKKEINLDNVLDLFEGKDVISSTVCTLPHDTTYPEDRTSLSFHSWKGNNTYLVMISPGVAYVMDNIVLNKGAEPYVSGYNHLDSLGKDIQVGFYDANYKKANNKRQFVELVSKYPIKRYNYRYVKKPKPIVLTTLEGGLSVNGVTSITECELDESLHRTILNIAVSLALQSRGLNVSRETQQAQ